MKVEVWSDIACPFCYIGKRNLEGALEQFAHRDAIEVVYRSFELYPDAPLEIDQSFVNEALEKQGMTTEQLQAKKRKMTELGRTVGIDYQWEQQVQTNMFDAHRLTHFAAQFGKQVEMTERLFKGYFSEGKHLGNHEMLAGMADDIGLDRSAALAAMKSKEFVSEVREDEQMAGQMGVRGVPFFVIDRKYAISGAQPVEVFLQTLEKAYR
ncbi:DsbA family oxidoreductase [Paenibacillus paridis]|uniref:DsbA family oxidoreductase n=1 Tax=Paenibacillus paridis TaxID=2583376 RepID=UPI0011219554|nr:DsbA family oxidoreductase [Paenibacillus paridis]